MARVDANVELGDLLVVGGITFAGLLLWDHNKNDGKFYGEIQSLVKQCFSKDDNTKSDDEKSKLDERNVSADASSEEAENKRGADKHEGNCEDDISLSSISYSSTKCHSEDEMSTEGAQNEAVAGQCDDETRVKVSDGGDRRKQTNTVVYEKHLPAADTDVYDDIPTDLLDRLDPIEACSLPGNATIGTVGEDLSLLVTKQSRRHTK